MFERLTTKLFMKHKNFLRISKLLMAKCQQVNPLFGLVSPMFAEFVSEQGAVFFERKGQAAYLKTARGYWNILTKKGE